MIGKNELKTIVDIKKLSFENAEKHYLQELILFSIYSKFTDNLIFKGGTSLYKFYNLNRFSEDLDFTLNKRRFDTKNFLKNLMLNMERLNINGKIKEVRRYKNEINIKLIFFGPLYNGSKESIAFVSLNISTRERVIQFERHMLIPSYREIPAFEIPVMSSEEILAEKIRAILTRNKARDIYDLWFLLKRGIRPNLNIINKKLKICKLKFSKKEFLKKIEEKRLFWEVDVKGLVIGNLPDFDKIVKEVKDMFKI